MEEEKKKFGTRFFYDLRNNGYAFAVWCWADDS